MIGIGVVTYNRENQINKVLSAINKDIADFFVVVNDGTPYKKELYPNHFTVLQQEENKGVAVVKNIALKHLMDKNCEHIFLVEDDMFIKNPAVFQKYIDLSKVSGIKHFNFAYHGPANVTPQGKPNPKFGIEYDEHNKMSINKHSVGAVSYYHRDVILKSGYINEDFRQAFDHVEHTYRIIKDGFHIPFWNFVDLHDSYDYITEIGNVNDNSVIRKGKEHTQNIKDSRELFSKIHGVDVLSIPDTSQIGVCLVLEELEKKKDEPVSSKISLKDFSFILPIKIDSEDRIKNLNTIISFYRKYCDDLQFIIIENDITTKLKKQDLNLTDNDTLVFINSDTNIFNKSKCYNTGAIMSNRKFIIATDVDCIVDPKNILLSKDVIKNDTFVRPYKGTSLYLTQKTEDAFIKTDYSLDYLSKIIPHINLNVRYKNENFEVGNINSPGGCVIFDKTMLLSNGGYNPNFKNWGYEDNEIIVRLTKLGNKFISIDDNIPYLWHFPHKSIIKNNHAFYNDNRSEVNKIQKLSKEALQEYIKQYK